VNEADCREEVSGQTVVTRCDAPEILQPAKAALDNIAILVGLLVVVDLPPTIRCQVDPRGLKEFAESVAVS
jgi:hypothetical protein